MSHGDNSSRVFSNFVYFSLDINECLNNTHQCESKVNGGLCINTVGSHDCSCLPGYDGDGWKVINALTEAHNPSRQGCSGTQRFFTGHIVLS